MSNLLNKARAKSIMKQAGVDALVATSPENITYLSDYEPGWLRIGPGAQTFGILPADSGIPLGLVLDSVELFEWAERPGEIEDVIVFGAGPNKIYRYRGSNPILAPDDQRVFDLTMAREAALDPFEALFESLRQRKLTDGVIGLEESHLTADEWQRIVSGLPRARVVPGAALFEQIRMVKTEVEIERLRRAAWIADQSIQAMFAAATEGMTERELATLFNAKVVELGGSPRLVWVSAARRSAHPTTRASGYPIQNGDIIKIDTGCTHESYWADVGRTKCLVGPTPQQERIYDSLYRGRMAAIQQARPGAFASQIHDTLVQTVRDHGIPDFQRQGSGHGIGLSMYDPPLIKPAGKDTTFGTGVEDTAIEVGMVMNIETAYYLVGDFGFIVEDTFLIQPEGAVALTQLDDSLFIPG
ncbi:MAG: Xaa-Pro peptidase family protein [Anaerolineales bacterium]